MSTFNSVSLARPRPGRWALLPLLGLLHFGVWLLVDAQWRLGSLKPAATDRIEIRLLPPTAPKPLLTPPARIARPLTTPIAARSSSITPRPSALPSSTGPAPPPEQLVENAPPAAPPRETSTPGLLINSEATRRALHQATRTPLLSERAAQAIGDGPPLEQSVRLGQEIQKAGNGDCLKGEFAGGGAGILSLPFWLLAEARGKCAR